MDQLRTALVWLKKHHFWVLCALVMLISIVSWAKASGKLSTLFNANQSQIKGEFTSVQGVKSTPFHANDDVNSNQEKQTAQQAADVYKLWKDLYDRQHTEVLAWPSELDKGFRDYVEKLQFGAPIRDDLRNHYFNYIENHFPSLPKQIEAKAIDPSMTGSLGSSAEFGRPRSFGPEQQGAPGTELFDDANYFCEWSPADQALVREDMNFNQQPTALKIWVTQENLWVYHTLLQVIANTNKAANTTRISNAAVQQIGQLAVGQRAGAVQSTGRLWVPPAAAAAAAPGEPGAAPGPPGGVGPEGGAPPGGPGGPGGEFSAGMMGGPGGGGAMTEEQEKMFLLSGRYLDPQGKPMPFAGGGAAPAADAGAPPPAADPAAAAQPLDLSAFGKEYKRLPVRMALRMDQRWLPRLLGECASQPLQIEVTEVRINPPEGITGAGAGSGMSRPGGIGMGGNASVFQEDPAFQPFPVQPEMVNVIIQGTVYIFNKPIPQTPAEQPAGAEPPATPAAAPAATP